MPVLPPQASPPFDFASALAKLRQGGPGALLNIIGLGQGSSSSPPPTQPPESQWRPPESPDFLGCIPFGPGHTGSSGQPTKGDGRIDFHTGPGSGPPAMTQDADGLLVSTPMAKAFKARQAAGNEAQRQAQSEETDAMVEELGKTKARKGAAWYQEVSARSAYDAQRSEAEFQALTSQRPRRTTPTRGASCGLVAEAVGVSVAERLKITLPSTGLTYEELKAIEKTAQRRQDRPTAIPLDELHTAEEVFQPRILVGDECVDVEHVRTLLAPLRDHGQPLGRLWVTPIGDRWFVIDGHHRLAAYIAHGLDKPIPVNVFEGDVDAAEAKAVGENSKDKLPMSKDSKLEKAWALTLRDVHTIALIVSMTTVSGRTVSNMRTRMRELGDKAGNYTWKQAKRGDMTQEDFDFSAWIEREAGEMAERVCKVPNKKVLQQPEVFARMIEMVNPQMIGGLLEQWAHDYKATFQQLVTEMTQEEALDL